MKKKALILLIIAVFFVNMGNAPANNARIASFNTLHLGWKGKNYQKTAQVLKNFDLIGLQEVMNPRGMEILREYLQNATSRPWKYHVSHRNAGKSSYREYYAYIWRSDRVRMLRSLGFFQENRGDDFIREPYAVIFKISDFDFTFVLCHLIFGTKYERRGEARRLVDVYNYFQRENGNDQDVVIAGDFNLPGNDQAFALLLKHPDEITYAISPEQRTTIGRSGQLVSAYDNFFYSTIYSSEILHAITINYLKNMDVDLIQARKSISDHIPITFLVYTRGDDD